MDTDPQSDTWFSAESSTFGDRMAGAREHMGMSRQDLARRLGVKLATIENWEDDLSEPRANKLQLLAGLLNVSLTWLLAAEGEGLDAPAETDMPHPEVGPILAEMRQVQGELQVLTNRLTVLEKRLRRALQERS